MENHDRESTINTLFKYTSTNLIFDAKACAEFELKNNDKLTMNETLNLQHVINRANYWLQGHNAA